MNKPTCLSTDWCKNGIGFILTQKSCECDSGEAPTCCKDGWKLIFAGFRFNTEAESRYAPVKGEALAVAYALQKCRMFVLGCPDLLVTVDHEPLVKLLGDRDLQDIPNPRLLRFKEKTLLYSYRIKYIPGKDNKAADVLSRNPHPEPTPDITAIEASVTASAVAALAEAADNQTVTWERVQAASHSDTEPYKNHDRRVPD